MRVCGNCQSDVADGSQACPRCGAEMPTGLFAAIGALFRKKAAAAPPAGRAAEPFAFEVEDVFTITGRGMVATGRVIRGRIAKNDEISFRSPAGEVIRRRIVAIETLGKTVESANAGDTVGLVFTKPVPFDVLVRGVVFERA